MMLEFLGRSIGDGYPCFVTFEAGATHNGVASAKALIDAAVQSGADAIKFQIFDPERLVADKKLLFSYEVLVDKKQGITETVNEPLYDILARRYLDPDDWKIVADYAASKNMPFFATVGFPEDIQLLEDIGCHSIKIASADVDHLPLIRRAAKTGMCIQLDTGNSTLGELETAVDEIKAQGNDKVIIHHCPSGYPAKLDSVNLKMIVTLKMLFSGVPIAFSDHSPGKDMDIAAVALGANMLEKTISMDRTIRSPEHLMSLDPKDMADFIFSIRKLEKALGATRRIMNNQQKIDRFRFRRSIYLLRDLAAGHQLLEEDLDFRRPGTGIPISALTYVLGKRLKTAMSSGDELNWSSLDF